MMKTKIKTGKRQLRSQRKRKEHQTKLRRNVGGKKKEK
jgi:hypothetical protein